MWIFNNKYLDLLFIHLPAFIFLLIINISGDYIYTLMFILAIIIVDIGHVYVTLWRTYFNFDEIKSYKLYYFLVPTSIFIIIFLWIYFQIPYLWSFVVYFTIYHYIRQFYGIAMWYSKLNKIYIKFTKFFIYSLLSIPVIIFHFRENTNISNYYTKGDLFLYPSNVLFNLFVIIFLMIFISWFIFELYLYNKNKFRINRFISILFPTILYFYGFVLSTNFEITLMSFVMAHGLPYIFLISFSLNKTRKDLINKLWIWIILIFFTAGFFGVIEFYFEKYLIIISNDYIINNMSLIENILIGIYLIPLLTHFIVDSHIWTSKHRESKKIFQKNK